MVCVLITRQETPYLYLTLYASIIPAKISVTKLATLTGMLWLSRPKTSHTSVPNVNSEYMANDMLEVSFVCMVLIACGRNEIVVQQAASSPMAVIRLSLIMRTRYHNTPIRKM